SCGLSRGGRTDKGVSAFGQVVSLRIRSALPARHPLDQELAYIALLNRALPPDIRVLAWSPTPDNFSARFSCESRTYRYHFLRGTYDLQAMHSAAQGFVGRHDFRWFCKADRAAPDRDTQRTLIDVDLLQTRAGSDLAVRGHAFLWHQIRFMMGVLFAVGEGRETPAVVPAMLAGATAVLPDGTPAPAPPDLVPADPRPLVFYDLTYPPHTLAWR
ncbi:tRNA pseudouridine synthase, partial [Caulochytrium protostelioides]